MEAGCRKLLQTFVKILRDLTKREKESDCRKSKSGINWTLGRND
jgi:hypothetical protein